ncbi:MAG: hypothetical protein LBN93_05840 [Candidatus Symbiothrix sp.]|jgi:hypothetical protein|nr:hypothetical protein [Candidatus Symbiothrix sp.]
MTMPEIVAREAVNTNRIYLYKEGSFWKAYEYSAYLFVIYIKMYQTKTKFLQNVGMQIVSIGFPDIALSKLLDGRNVVFQDNSHVILQIELSETSAKETFAEWKIQRLPAPQPLVEKDEESTPPTEKYAIFQIDLHQSIREFPLATSTPMDCMNFLADLKRQVQNAVS